MFVNDISISQKLRSKGYLSIEKYIMKYKQITATLLNEASVSNYMST